MALNNFSIGSFRLSATHLRVLLILLNLALAFGLVGMGAYSVHNASSTTTTAKYVNPKEFGFVEADRPVSSRWEQRQREVAEWWQPRPPQQPKIDDPEATEPTTPDPGVAEEIIDGGPLAQEWEYVWYLLWPGDPTRSVVRLQRKGSEAAPAKGVKRTSRSVIRRRGAAKAAKNDDVLVFRVGDRYIKDDDKELEFMVAEASAKYLTYLEVKDRKRKYRLPYKEKSFYASQKGDKTLRGEEEEPDPDGDEKELHFTRVPLDQEDLREAQFKEWLGGTDLNRLDTLQRTDGKDAFEQDDEESGAATTPVSASGAPKKPMTREEGVRAMSEAMREARKKGTMTAKEEKLLKDAMTGKLKLNKSKK